MLKRFALASLAIALAAGPALADGKIYVQLPDLSSYEGHRAEEFLQAVVTANVVSSNCPGYEITEEEWSLITDSADILAYGQLKLDTDTYDSVFYKQAFDQLDEAGTCEREGPGVEQVISELVSLGGSTEALPDQEAAYEEWRVMMDELQAGAEAAPAAETGKTKVK